MCQQTLPVQATAASALVNEPAKAVAAKAAATKTAPRIVLSNDFIVCLRRALPKSGQRRREIYVPDCGGGNRGTNKLRNQQKPELTNNTLRAVLSLFQFRRPTFQREFAKIAPNDSDQPLRQEERRRFKCNAVGGDWPMGQPNLHRQTGKLSPTRRKTEESNADA